MEVNNSSVRFRLEFLRYLRKEVDSLGSTFCWTTACLKDWRTLAAFQGAINNGENDGNDGQCVHGKAREHVEAFTVQIL